MKKTQLILTTSLQQVTFPYLRGFHQSYALFCSYEEEGYHLNVDWSLKTEIFVFSTGFTLLSVLLLFPLSITVLFFVPFLMLFLKQEKGNFDGDQ